jgi:hypothetical protein
LVQLKRLEAKQVAEYLNFKICSILFRVDSRGEAIRQFRGHLRSYKQQVEPEGVAFEHWSWVARQYCIFGEMIEAAARDHGSTTPDSGVTDRWQWPALYFHAAAKYTKRRRTSAEQICGMCPPGAGTATGGPRPPIGSYYGQLQLMKHGSEQNVESALVEAESSVQHSLYLVELLSRAYNYFKRQGSCNRMIHGLVAEMAEEYYLQGEYSKAQRLFESISPSYRKEGWTPILTAAVCVSSANACLA